MDYGNYGVMNNGYQQQPLQPNLNYKQQPQLTYNNSMLLNAPYTGVNGQFNNVQNGNLMYNQFLKCRPVSSKDQAKACQIDLDGSLWVFTDLGNQKIYTKQINSDGTATFKTYAFTQDENPYNTNQYITRDEFNKVINAVMASIVPQEASQESPAANIKDQVNNF